MKSRLVHGQLITLERRIVRFALHQPFNFWDEFAAGVRFDDLNPRFEFVGGYGLLSSLDVVIVDVYLAFVSSSSFGLDELYWMKFTHL